MPMTKGKATARLYQCLATSSAPRSHGVFANFRVFKGDHIVVYIVEHWHPVGERSATLEIVEQKFFAIGSLPSDFVGGARRRLAEVFENRPLSPDWES
jgi:hypothetical protein